MRRAKHASLLCVYRLDKGFWQCQQRGSLENTLMLSRSSIKKSSLLSVWLAFLIEDAIFLSRDPSLEIVLSRYLKVSTFLSWVQSKTLFGSEGLELGAGWCSTSFLLRLIVKQCSLNASEKLSNICCKSRSLCDRRVQLSAKRASWWVCGVSSSLHSGVKNRRGGRQGTV